MSENSSFDSWAAGEYSDGGNSELVYGNKHERDRVALEHRSCFMFPKVDGEAFSLRRIVFDLTHHRVFEVVVVILIVANCVFLAIDDPVTPQNEKPAYLQQMEYFFTACFAVELLLKVFSQGFVLHPGSYLRTGWNRLDFVIVTFSFLSFIPSVGNYTALRTLRVLRPLRSINGIQGLRNIVNGLLHSLRKLVNVLALAAFIFSIFGILGVQLWAGKFTYRCQKIDTNTTCTPSGEVSMCCLPDMSCCFDPMLTAIEPMVPDSNLSCLSTEGNPCGCRVKGTMGNASLVLWEDFCNPSASEFFFMGEMFGRGCEASQECVDTGVNPNFGFTNFDHFGYAVLVVFQCLTLEGWTDIMYIVQDVSSDLGCIYFIMLVVLGSYFVLNLALAVINEEFDKIGREEEEMQERKLLRIQKMQEQALLEIFKEEIDNEVSKLGSRPASRPVTPNAISGQLRRISEKERCEKDNKDRATLGSGDEGNLSIFDLMESAAPSVEKQPACYAQIWSSARWGCWNIVRNRFFTPTIIFFIVINTALLASEHHNQPKTLTVILEKANIVLMAIFSIEMVLKLMGSGLKGYLRDPFNVLDGSVVLLSILELVLLSNNTVSVFRALRLLRVFKLLKNFPQLRDLVEVILAAVSDTGYLNLIILLYIFCAALVGMQIFGGKFNFEQEGCAEPPCDKVKPRATFDSFYWSVLTVFQVLTRDDWVNVMWDAMRATHPICTLYFLVLVVCGDFVILNLFLAILIQSFDQNMRSDCNKGDDDEEVEEEEPPPPVSEKSFRERHGSNGSVILTVPISSQRVGGKRESFVVTEMIRTGSVIRCKSELLDKRGRKGSLVNTGSLTGNRALSACLSPTLGARKRSIMSAGMSSHRYSAFSVTQPSTLTTSAVHNHEALSRSSIVSLTSTPSIKPLTPKSPGPALPGQPIDDKACLPRKHTETPENHLRPFNTVGNITPCSSMDEDCFLPHDDYDMCHKCKEPQAMKGISQEAETTQLKIHDKLCKKIQLRKLRQKRLLSVIAQVEKKVANGAEWQEKEVEQVISLVWEVGLWQDKMATDFYEVLTYIRVTARDYDTWGLTLAHLEMTVEKGSPAYQVGLRDGNILTKVGGEEVDSDADAKQKIVSMLECEGRADLDVVKEKTWDGLLQELREQMGVLSLEIGEGDKIFGGAFVAFSSGNLPNVTRTNGGNSLFIFGPGNWFRLLSYKIVKDPNFEKIILMCILCSSILMVAENPRNEATGDWGTALVVSNYIFTGTFILEMLMKIIAFGLILGKGTPNDPPYLKDKWNVLDGTIVFFAILSIALVGYNFSILKVLRAFRALRPLRVISRNRGLRMVVITLLRSISSIGNVAFVTFIVFLVFGILGVQLFAGKLYRCTDPMVINRLACNGYFVDESGDLSRRIWRTDHFGNFDNIYNSILTLFEVATLELWTTIMYRAIDGISYDRAPERDYNQATALFFIGFVIVGSFFILNLFVGFVIFNFAKVKAEEDGSGVTHISPEQKLWMETQQMMLNFRPMVKMVVAGNSPWRRRLHCFCISNTFEIFIGVAILLNVVVMSLEHNGMSKEWEFSLWLLNIFFMIVFLVEAAAKLLAFGSSYLKDPWNRFDFALVILSIVQFLLFMLSMGIPVKSYILRVGRVFRIMRIVRLVKSAKDVRILLETIWYSLPHIANIGAFLCLLFFIYSVLGVKLFAKVKRGQYLTKHANFESFPRALMMLIRMATGENWNGVMHETMVTSPDCSTELDNCGEPAAPLYYLSFLLLATFILTNLFVAIILDNFRTTILIEKSDLRMTDLHTFIERWADFDPDATLKIPTSKLPFLLEQIGTPLGIRRRDSRIDILNRTKSYCIPEHGGVIHFIETLIPLARLVMVTEGDLGYTELRNQEEQWRQAFPDINDLPLLRFRQRRVTVDQYFSSTYIAAAYRRAVTCRHYYIQKDLNRKRRRKWQLLNMVSSNLSCCGMGGKQRKKKKKSTEESEECEGQAPRTSTEVFDISTAPDLHQ